MYTIIESPEFQAKANKLWSANERLEFFTYVANNPLVGDVIPHASGLRKIRWSREGMGKRGGVRVIYINLLGDGVILMWDIYAKSEKENISPKDLKKLRGQ